MVKQFVRYPLALGLCLFAVVGCSLPATSTADSSEPPAPVAETAATATASPVPEPTVAPTPTEPPLPSLRIPEFSVSEPVVIYTRAQRIARNLPYWPDGNMGILTDGETIHFYAANSVNTAHTVGSFDDPATERLATGLRIEGIGPDFAYAAGGPIYQDPETGMVLMFYHAERHFGGSGVLFYSELGLARSNDGGVTFQDLGIYLTANAPADASRSRAVEMTGGPYVIMDGYFYVYFHDMLAETEEDVHLAVARAPVDAVLQAAAEGMVTTWEKYYLGAFSEPGIGGLSSPLEIGNPLNRWMSVSYNTALEQLIAVIVETTGSNTTLMHLITSPDGIHWSPRVTLQERTGELFYPSIISKEADAYTTGASFYVYYTAAPGMTHRWETASVERLEVTVTGELHELGSAWDFDSDAGGWMPLWDIAALEVADGALVMTPGGPDPHMRSPLLGLSTELYTKIEVRMRSALGGVGQFFFIATDVDGYYEENSAVFEVQASDDFVTYTLDMANVPGWDGHLLYLRFDPISGEGAVVIDAIRLLP